MNYDNVKDYRAQKFLKKAISNRSGQEQFILRTLTHCGNRAASDYLGVALFSNKKHSRYYGAKMCDNSWVCPVCSAVQMSKTAAQVGAAIDMLQDKYNAIMITFTVFHSKNDSCQQVMDVLYKTWEKTTYKGRKGSFPHTRFMEKLEIKHKFRCCEITYSENGWHPHFHCLYWIPKEHFDEVLDWEKILREQWRLNQERSMIEVYGFAKYNAFYESERLHGEIAAGVYISKDTAKNKPAIMKSSDYICGWGGDKEVTGNYMKKATNPNSLTVYQLLQKAYDGDEDALEKYLELAKYVILHKRRRYDFSKNGFKANIKNYMQAEEYKKLLKKKRTKYLEDTGKWKLVSWFSSSLWLKISSEPDDLKALILELAKLEDGHLQICNELKKRHFDEMPLNYDPVGYADAMLQMLNTA